MGRCTGAFAEHALMDARERSRCLRIFLGGSGIDPARLHGVHDMLIAQGKLKSGEWLLVTGISAGVGVAALQTAKALGAKVIGTSGSARSSTGSKRSGSTSVSGPAPATLQTPS